MRNRNRFCGFSQLYQTLGKNYLIHHAKKSIPNFCSRLGYGYRICIGRSGQKLLSKGGGITCRKKEFAGTPFSFDFNFFQIQATI